MAREVTFKNISISYTDKGKGRAVVFLHGFLESKEIWKPFVKDFPKSCRIITIDLLGHGDSDCLSYVHSMEEMAEAVESVLKHLKLRQVFLIGHSMGGYVSLALAEKNPDMVRGLCLFHSTARADSASKKKDRNRAIKVVKKNHQLFINEAIPNLFYTKKKPHKRGIDKLKRIALSTSLQGIVAALEGMKNRLEREIILKFAPYPVLFIIGKEDHILKYTDLIDQAKIANNGSYLLLENVGHSGFIEAKEECVKAIKEFVLSN